MGRHASVLAIALAACGTDPAPASTPAPTSAPPPAASPAPERAAPPPTRDEEVVPEATVAPGAPFTAGALQVVGADRLALLFLDTGAATWSPETVSVGELAVPGRPLAAVTFLGCGARAAVRTRSDHAVYERTGARLSVAPLPDLVEALGDRLEPEIADLVEEFESHPAAHDLLGRGELSRDPSGALLLATEIDLAQFHGELEGCLRISEALRISLALPDGLGDTSCTAPERRLIDPWSVAPVPDGWRCTHRDVGPEGEPAPSWLGIEWEAAAAALHVPPCDEVPSDPWERLEVCAGYTELIGCRRDGDPSVFVTAMPEPTEGCAGHPDVVVLRGGHAFAHTGASSRIVEFDRSLVALGGADGWFVTSAEHPPVRFGVVAPDVVRAP